MSFPYPSMVSILILSSLVPIPLPAVELHHRGWETCACKAHFKISVPSEAELTHGSNTRNYARDREIDLKHVLLDLTPDFDTRELDGIATLTFSPIAKPINQLKLDGINLDVSAIEASVPLTGWEAGKTEITLNFAAHIEPGVETWIKVTYHAAPRAGFYFRTAAMGYPEGDDHFWTQGEPELHRHWFPGYDFPN